MNFNNSFLIIRTHLLDTGQERRNAFLSIRNFYCEKGMYVSLQDVITATFAFIDFLLFIFGVIGNAIVIYVIISDRKLKNKSNYHILSVAVADFLIVLPGIPLSVIAVSQV